MVCLAKWINTCHAPRVDEQEQNRADPGRPNEPLDPIEPSTWNPFAICGKARLLHASAWHHPPAESTPEKQRSKELGAEHNRRPGHNAGNRAVDDDVRRKIELC